ncbi:hypothetical protein DRO61_07690 [Candidatus Bathyarchaeota archaeon]|nr:MAG: hypothetical protein DRO61_07690 [Candidatus Bathyarchaeota archaeon]
MVEGNNITGEEALDKSISLLNKLKNQFPSLKVIAYIIAFLSAGGGTVFVWVWDKSQDHIIKVATPKIIHYADSISNAKIKHVIDSINLSNEWRRDIYQIGLFGSKSNGKVLYRHTDNEVYRAIFKPKYDYYYYFNDKGEWKQVK